MFCPCVSLQILILFLRIMRAVDKGVRAGNFIIDLVAYVIVFVLIAWPIAFVFPGLINKDANFNILASIVFFLYYFLSELFYGKTIGKVLTGTVVVDKNGNRPTVFKLFIRTLMRLFPFEVISFLLSHTGLHDLISSTIVIKFNKIIINEEVSRPA
jgi:uncharacterized RDD family membrane protein YckC